MRPIYLTPRRGALTLTLTVALLGAWLVPTLASGHALTGARSPLASGHVLTAPRPRLAQWHGTGAALRPLAYDTATLLPTGYVLFAGGAGFNGSALSSNIAELYNPATGTFIYTHYLIAARQLHFATLLRTGRVLLAGGESGDPRNPQTAITSAELYDPATNTFTPTGALVTPRDEFMGARLADGRVLLAGGCNGTFNGCTTTWSSAELYDPATGTFTATGAMHGTRMGGTATLLFNGQVLLVGGGACNACGSLASAELYDPATGTFTPTLGQPHVARALHTATLLPDGQVLLAGGCTTYREDCYPPGGALASAELYHPRTQQFTLTGALHTARYNHTATLLPAGQVLLAGGAHASSDPSTPQTLNSAELYTPLTGRFSVTAPMTVGQESATATLLPGGRVLVVGGCLDGAGSCLSAPTTAAELYTP